MNQVGRIKEEIEKIEKWVARREAETQDAIRVLDEMKRLLKRKQSIFAELTRRGDSLKGAGISSG